MKEEPTLIIETVVDSFTIGLKEVFESIYAADFEKTNEIKEVRVRDSR